MRIIFIGLAIFALAFIGSSCKKRFPGDEKISCEEIARQVSNIAQVKDPEPAVEERYWNLRDLFLSKCQSKQQ